MKNSFIYYFALYHFLRLYDGIAARQEMMKFTTVNYML